jgi:hypothetical protein
VARQGPVVTEQLGELPALNRHDDGPVDGVEGRDHALAPALEAERFRVRAGRDAHAAPEAGRFLEPHRPAARGFRIVSGDQAHRLDGACGDALAAAAAVFLVDGRGESGRVDRAQEAEPPLGNERLAGSPWEVIALALAYEMLGRREESLATIGKMTATDAIFRGYAGALLARLGKRAEAEGILAGMKAQKGYVPAFYLALVHLGLGQTDETFRYLEKAYDERSSTLYDSISLDPQWTVVHGDPRYKDLLRRLGLPPPRPATR